MFGFLKLLSPTMWVAVALAGALAFAGVQTLRLSWVQTDLAKAQGQLKECNIKISVQNDSIAALKRESDRQKALVAQSAVEAHSAALRWQARLDAAKSDRPTVSAADGPLAVCKASLDWFRERENVLHVELNNAN